MSTPNTPTLRDVASAAGVAVSTVSYALNGKGRVDAALALGFKRLPTALDTVPIGRPRISGRVGLPPSG